MNGLLQEIEATTSEPWPRYAEILAGGDAGDADELRDIMQVLGLNGAHVRTHSEAIAEARRHAAEIRQVEGTRRKSSTVGINSRLSAILATYPFLFFGEDGRPVKPGGVRFECSDIPRGVERLLDIEPVQRFSASQICERWGIDRKALKTLTPMFGTREEPVYFGAVVLAWALAIVEYTGNVRERMLRDQIVSFDLHTAREQLNRLSKCTASVVKRILSRTPEQLRLRDTREGFEAGAVIRAAELAKLESDRAQEDLFTLEQKREHIRALESRTWAPEAVLLK